MKILLSESHSTSINRGTWTFTSMLSEENTFLFLDDHLERLFLGAKFLYPDLELNNFKADLTFFLKEHFKPKSYYRINLIYDCIRVEIKSHLPKSSHVNLTKAVSKKSETVIPAFLKIPNYLVADTELRLAQLENFDDVLFFDENDHALEATSSNLFVITPDQMILTPPLSSMVLEGVLRKNLLKFLLKNNYQVQEVTINENDVINANGVFLTNSIQGLRSVKNYKTTKFLTDQVIYDNIYKSFGRFGEKFNE